MPRRGRSIGTWHHQTTTALTGVVAANTVSFVNLVIAGNPLTIRALSIDLVGFDSGGNSNWLVGTFVQPGGTSQPTDPTTTDALQALFWTYGAEKLTSSYGFCMHINPR